MNKRGSEGFEIGGKFPFIIMFALLITFLFLMFGIVIAVNNNQLTAVPPKLNAELIALRFGNVEECFAFKDPESGRIFSGTIDLSKFNEDELNKCYSAGIKYFQFRLNLPKSEKEITTNKYYFHDKDKLTMRKEVLVKDGEELVKDQLVIFVQEKIGS